MPWSVSIINRYSIRKLRVVKCQILLVLRGRISRGFIRTPLCRPLPPWLPGRAVAQSPHPLPPLPPDLHSSNRAQRARLVDHLRRSRPAASVHDLGTSPFRQRRRRGFAVVGAETKPHATL